MLNQKFIYLILLSLLATACSSARPSIYPNEHYKKVGKVQAERDMQNCENLADEYVKDPARYQKVAKNTAVGAGVGAGTGALASTIIGGAVGRGTAAGAATGAIATIVYSLINSGEQNPTRRKFMQRCMSDYGYEVLS